LITSFGELRFTLSAFETYLPVSSHGFVARLEVLDGFKGNLRLCRLQDLQGCSAIRGAEEIAAKRHARPCALVASPSLRSQLHS
jgi:hypothetical protein